MLTSGMDPTLRVVMMATTMLVAIPTGIKIFNWLATLWGGALVFKTHTLWALGFVVTFTLGGISGMFFPVVGLDMHFHDTYFVVAHFHYVLIGGTIFGLFAGLYYWYPKAFGRKLSERLGVIHFLISFISYNAAFWPMHVVGTMGMPRRTHTYTVESGYAALNYSISVASFIFGLAQLILVWNLIYSSKKGEKIGEDPWGGWSLEWTTASPPPTPSFAEIPTQGDDNEHEEKGWLTRMASRLWSLGMKKEVRH
jgi:cytochrome c oxidase subunit 1